jgi:lysyl-tRNA synthetase class 2
MERSNQAPVISTDESAIRRLKVETLRAQGIEPWPNGLPVDARVSDILAEFKDGHEYGPQAIAGRIMSMRGHGKAVFAHLQDSSGKMQLYIKQDLVGETNFKLWQQFIDIGDIVWCKGTPFRTKTGEVTLQVSEFFLESKCLHPLPDKFHGIADIEMKYRQRYLDLISDPASRQRFYDRSKIVRTLRETFDSYGFMEVETPMLHPIPGGAAARPFVTHHNALNMELYLRIAPELYLKRLVVGGFERVYEINRNFRNEGVSTRHNPEFTMLECYVAHHDYLWMMNFLENLIRTVALAVRGGVEVQFRDKLLNLNAPFVRMTMAEAVAKTVGCPEADLTDERIDAVAQKHGITRSTQLPTWGHILYALFDKLVEPHLWNPTFITDFPSVVSPLAKRKPSNPDLTDRFELFVANMELANGFNELNDPDDQAVRFKEQVAARETGDAEAHQYDADYIRALEYALPPTVGAGIGIDRLTMLLTDAHSIKDVILFPTMRKE